MEDLLSKVEMCHLQGSALELAEIIGLDAFKELVRYYGGTSSLYVPQSGKIIIPVRDEIIRNEYDGSNTRQLARCWGLTERHVQNIVQDIKK